MSVCASCGGTNSAGAIRCEYCDSPLGGRQVVEVAWIARSGEGAVAEGRLAVDAPAGTDASRVRALAEAAFSASHDALGSGVDRSRLEQDMGQRLTPLLGQDLTLKSFTVTTYSPPHRPAPAGQPRSAAPPVQRGGGAGRLFACGSFAFSLLFLACGGTCLIGGFASSTQVHQVASAQVVPAAQAGSASGTVCVEHTVAAVASPLVAVLEDGERVPCLYLEETRVLQVEEEVTARGRRGRRRGTRTRTRTDRHTEKALAELRLGALTVRGTDAVPPGTQLSGVRDLGRRTLSDEEHLEFRGIPVETPLTLVATASQGVVDPASGTFLISTHPDRATLLGELRSTQKGMTVLGAIAVGLGLVMLLGSLAFALRRR